MNFPNELRIVLKSKKDGLPISNIVLSLRLYAERKNDYVILLPNSNQYGTINVSKEQVKNEIEFKASTAIMDYSSDIEHCKSFATLSVLSTEQIFTLYKNGMDYKQRLLFPSKYKMLELAENFKVKQENIDINIIDKVNQQINEMYLKTKNSKSYYEEEKQLERDKIFIVAGYGNLNEFKKIFSPDDVNIKSRFGLGLLHAAVAGQKWDIALFLLDNNIDANLTDYNGRTALHYIAHFPNLLVAEKIFECGGDININDFSGNNAFFLATLFQKNNYGFLKFLLKYSPDLSENKGGYSPLKLAQIEKDEFLINLLKNHSKSN